jgi:hypothetical protein
MMITAGSLLTVDVRCALALIISARHVGMIAQTINSMF